jgi:arylsulfatase A-like enzyme
VETVDIFPTVLDAAGCEPSQRALGQSLMPLVDGDADEVGDAAFSEVDQITMVRTRTHKYAMDAQGRGFMLYDLEADAEERNNLVGHPDCGGLEMKLRDRIPVAGGDAGEAVIRGRGDTIETLTGHADGVWNRERL